jgi:hypothetical protein
MNIKLVGLLAVSSLLTSGCAGAVIGAALAARTAAEPIPIASVLRQSDGREFVSSGRLALNMDGSSSVRMAIATDGIECAGDINARGVGEVICTGGIRYPIQIPREQFGRMSGAYVDRQSEFTLSVGWGDRADPEALRLAISD